MSRNTWFGHERGLVKEVLVRWTPPVLTGAPSVEDGEGLGLEAG
jgi:hypothetical protein